MKETGNILMIMGMGMASGSQIGKNNVLAMGLFMFLIGFIIWKNS